MHYLVVIIVSLMLFMSIWQYLHVPFQYHKYKLHLSFELFYTLMIIYISVIIGFGIIYFILSMEKELLLETGQTYPIPPADKLLRSLYFSGVTMLTIGYGDIVPIGTARLVAITQALIGYLLPTTFVLKLVQLNIKKEAQKMNDPNE